MNKIISILLIFSIFILNTGCSDKSNVSETIQTTLLSFKSTDIDMAEDFTEIISTERHGESLLIFGKLKSGDYSGYITDSQFRDKKRFIFVPQENELVKSAALITNGGTAVLSVIDNDTVIYQYDNECKLQRTISAGEIITENDYYADVLSCSDGYYINVDYQRIVFIDKKGNYKGTVNTERRNIVGITSDNEDFPCVLLSSNNKTYLGKLSEDKITEEISCGELASYVNGICKGFGEYSIAAVESNGLFVLDNDKWKRISDFSDNDFSIQYIRDIEMIGEEEFVVILNYEAKGYQMRLLTQRNISEIQQKKIIQVALTYGGNTDPYTDLVKKYNSESDKYRVEFVDYFNEDQDEEYNQLKMDIISGKCPDIVLFSNRMPVECFGDEKSIFVDFYNLIDNDSEINRSDFLEGFLEKMETKGKLLQLNPCFIIESKMIKTKYAKGYTSWNSDTFSDIVKNVPDNMELYIESKNFSKSDIFLNFVDCYQFINKDKSSCNFNSSEFINLLKNIKGLDVGGANDAYPGIIRDEGTMINSFRNDNVLIQNVKIRNLSDFRIYKQVYSDEASNFIGYINDNEIRAISHPCQTFGIMANSPNIEGAWDFLKYYMFQEDSLNEKYFMGLPGYKKIFEKLLNEELINEYKYTFFLPDSLELNEVELHALTDEETIEVKELVYEALQNSKQNDKNIDIIISDEINSYFGDEKSAEQTAEYIQNRVGIYLSEIY